MSTSTKILCIHSYNGLRVSNNGSITPCCYYNEMTPFLDSNGSLMKTDTHTISEMMDNPSRNKLISDLENGIKHIGCKRCWEDEEYHGESKRTRDLKFGYENDKSVKYLELNLGNTCNMACRMCSVGASIKWYGEHQTIYEQDTDLKDDVKYKNWVREYYKSYETESMFWGELEKELPNIKQIDMYGGEPMLVKKQWETLKKSIELGYAKDQELHFNTNGTIFREEYIEILKEFKRVVISFSLDATNERFNYIRHHGDWKVVTNNIQKWIDNKSDNISFDVAVTVTNLNIYYLDELVDWCIEMNLNPYFIDVWYPDFYSPSNLPISVKNSINKKFHIYLYKEHIPPHIVSGIRGSLQNMNDTELNDIVWQKFLKNNKFLDDSRNQKFEETFPELNSLI
jgi:organic radical activating enzyme